MLDKLDLLMDASDPDAVRSPSLIIAAKLRCAADGIPESSAETTPCELAAFPLCLTVDCHALSSIFPTYVDSTT